MARRLAVLIGVGVAILVLVALMFFGPQTMPKVGWPTEVRPVLGARHGGHLRAS